MKVTEFLLQLVIVIHSSPLHKDNRGCSDWRQNTQPDVDLGVLGNNSIQIGYKLSLDTLVLIVAVWGRISCT